MPPTITIPIWALIAFVVLLVVTSAVLSLRRRVKKKKDRTNKTETPPAPSMTMPSGFSENIHHQILLQQIDNVFNALSAVIETERIKLKALIDHGPFPEMRSPSHVKTVQQPADCAHESDNSGKEMVSDILTLSQQGMPPEEIARRLSVSFNEVMLAIKINGGGGDKPRTRLEAVA